MLFSGDFSKTPPYFGNVLFYAFDLGFEFPSLGVLCLKGLGLGAVALTKVFGYNLVAFSGNKIKVYLLSDLFFSKRPFGERFELGGILRLEFFQSVEFFLEYSADYAHYPTIYKKIYTCRVMFFYALGIEARRAGRAAGVPRSAL